MYRTAIEERHSKQEEEERDTMGRRRRTDCRR
jgi:hypothetical protein